MGESDQPRMTTQLRVYGTAVSPQLFLLIGCAASHDCNFHGPDRVFAPFRKSPILISACNPFVPLVPCPHMDHMEQPIS